MSVDPLSQLLSDLDIYAQQVQRPLRIRRPVQHVAPFQPRFAVRETETAYELYARLPGVERDNLQVDLTEEQTLVIRGRVEHTPAESKPEPAAAGAPAVEAPEPQSPTKHYQATVEDGADDDEDDDYSEIATPATPTQAQQPAPAQQQQRSESKPRERVFIGEFARTFTFPGRVDADGLSAGFNNGVLKVTVPKEKEHQVRRIIVN
ncbi:HSP20-like chaperone [Lasiosphaeria miniovina]|uniref:HSP20-like chaperone n=1 Tax=Lasiosphaeria miniovina TaxID=1954250 RepID=A0AA40ATQ8_9PEZI|nr:HSP20-like chaperone [Lasiosphaeria miniovina]KAK0721846.1 HSP20-like chaperone [Lasiosphaeria miniovina]